MEKVELVVAALQQRIGELVVGYETQIASLRADITMLIDNQEKKDEAVQKYSEHLDNLSN